MAIRMNLKKTSSIVLNISIKMVVILLLVGVVYFVGSKSFAFGEKIFSGEGIADGDGEDIEVTIPSGATTKEVANILKDNGLIDDTLAFMAQTTLYEGKYYSGNYTLNTSMGVEKIIEVLKEGEPETTTTKENETTTVSREDAANDKNVE